VDVVVIGGGPAGYVAALRAAQLGGKVALVESGSLGGTCLNVGCIPTKAFLHSAKLLREVKGAKSYGIETDAVRLNFPAVRQRKDQIVRRLTGGVAGLLKAAGVQVFRGQGHIPSPGVVQVSGADNTQLTTKSIIVATGSAPVDIPVARQNGRNIVSSTEALSFDEVPARLLILGGGVIGCEFASIYRSFGSEVTIVEAEEQLLPREDSEAAALLAKEFKKDGVTLMLGCKLTGTAENPDGTVTATIQTKTGESQLTAEKILVSVGRRPRLAGLGLEALGVNLDRGTIVVDQHLETSVSGIFAAGDVTGSLQLAHVAFHEGAAAAENAMGRASALRLHAIPRCVYSFPEIGGVGLTESEAQAKYGEVKVGRFNFGANGKAMVLGETTGFVKVLAR
jgi:dihydrolipoamide dehydrogenase